MLGFAFPEWRTYDVKQDRKRAWSRELMLRIVKKHGPVNKYEHVLISQV